MIIGHGVDIVKVDRFNTARLDRLAQRILTPQEYLEYQNTHVLRQYLFVAKIWALKEAVSKAFGIGIRGAVVWKNIQVSKNVLGQPQVIFLNILAKTNLTTKCHVSVSHDGDYLVASAILEHFNDY